MAEFDLEELTNGWISNKDLKNDERIKIQKLLKEHNDKYCTPAKKDIFNAFKFLKLEDTKVIILGQDPYPDPEKAHGYAFSFKNNQKPATYSLRKIFDSLNFNIKTKNTNLSGWVKQGVLLLNTSLTYHNFYIEKNINAKDRKKYKKEQDKFQKEHLQIWHPFIIKMIEKIITVDSNNPLVIFLWGTPSQNTVFDIINNLEINKIKLNGKDTFDKNDIIKQRGILGFIKLKYNKRQILLLQCSHPQAWKENNTFKSQAPQQFKQCNEFLKNSGSTEINWQDL